MWVYHTIFIRWISDNVCHLILSNVWIHRHRMQLNTYTSTVESDLDWNIVAISTSFNTKSKQNKTRQNKTKTTTTTTTTKKQPKNKTKRKKKEKKRNKKQTKNNSKNNNKNKNKNNNNNNKATTAVIFGRSHQAEDNSNVFAIKLKHIIFECVLPSMFLDIGRWLKQIFGVVLLGGGARCGQESCDAVSK